MTAHTLAKVDAMTSLASTPATAATPTTPPSRASLTAAAREPHGLGLNSARLSRRLFVRPGLGMLAGAALLTASCGAAASAARPAEPSSAPAAATRQLASFGGSAGETTAASGQSGSLSGGTRTNEASQVTVQVTWAGPEGGPVFTVALDTHSVDLDAIDLRQQAVLRIDGGPEIRPSGWDAPKGGHHRQGALTFPTASGQLTMTSGTRSVELVLRGIAGVPERRFTW